MMKNQGGQKMNPSMPPPNMYIPYPVDPRYYMSYPPPQYMPKKGEEPPRDPREPKRD